MTGHVTSYENRTNHELATWVAKVGGAHNGLPLRCRPDKSKAADADTAGPEWGG
jgi:hypothetical protein